MSNDNETGPSVHEIVEHQSVRIVELESELKQAVKNAETVGFSRGVTYCLAKGTPVTWENAKAKMAPPGVLLWVCDAAGNVGIDVARAWMLAPDGALSLVSPKASKIDGVMFEKYGTSVIAWAPLILPPAPVADNAP